MENLVRDCLPSKDSLTISHYQGACAEPLQSGTMGDLVMTSSKRDPNRVVYCIPEYKQQLTTLDLHLQSDAVSKSLLSLGVTKGDVVLCVGVATSDLFSVMHGTYAIGGIYIGETHTDNPAQEWPGMNFHHLTSNLRVIRQCSLRKFSKDPCSSERQAFATLFCKTRQAYLFEPEDKCLTGIVKAVKPKILVCGYNTDQVRDALLCILTGSDEDSFTPQAIITYNMDLRESDTGCKGCAVFTFQDLIKRGASITDESLASSKSAVTQDDTALIISSTGTTGAPKLICVSHHTLVNFAKFSHIRMNPTLKPEVEAWLGPYGDDVNLAMQSLSALFYSNVTGVMLPSVVNDNKVGTEVVMTTIESEKVTTLMIYPFWVLDILNSCKRLTYDLSSLRKGVLMSQMINSQVRLKVQKHFPEYVVGYGSTEYLLGTSTSSTQSSFEEYMTTEGYAFPHTESKIVGENGETLPVESVGEICLKGWPAFNGYYGNNTQKQNPMDENGWYHTGDMGKMSPNGHVTLLGRKSDCIRYKKRGDVVYPDLIENVAKQHEKIKDAAVIGVEDEKIGDLIHLCVVTEDESCLSEDDVTTFLKAKLFDRDQPDFVHFFQSLPRVGTRRKISRALVKDAVMKTLLPQRTT